MNPGAGTGELGEQLGEVFVGAFVGSRRGRDEQGTGREAAGGEIDRRLEQLRQWHRAESLVQAPSTRRHTPAR